MSIKESIAKMNLQRLGRAVQLIERQYRNPVLPQRTPVIWPNEFCVCAKTDSGGVAAMTGTTPGTGTITLYFFDGTSLTANSTTDTAYNNMTTAVAGSAWIKVARVGQYWFVINEDC